MKGTPSALLEGSSLDCEDSMDAVDRTLKSVMMEAERRLWAYLIRYPNRREWTGVSRIQMHGTLRKANLLIDRWAPFRIWLCLTPLSSLLFDRPGFHLV